MAMTDEERKAKRRAYEQTPEVKAKRKEYLATPERMAKRDNDNRAWMLEESPENVAQEYIDSHN